MPKLAVVAAMSPASARSGRCARRLLPALRAREELRLFVQEPHHLPAHEERRYRARPLADLGHAVTTGEVDVPVYLFGAESVDGVQLDVMRRCPGVVVLLGGQKIPGEAAGSTVFAGPALDPASATSAERLPEDPEAAADRLVVATGSVLAEGPLRVRSRGRGPSVEAMVLSYRSRDFIAPCLESLLAQDWENLRITVIDNASGDGTADFVRERFPSIDVVEAPRNLGFSAGHDLLFERSTADYFALLNHDAVARRNWIAELVAVAEEDPEVAVVGSKMLMKRCPSVLNSTAVAMNRSGFAADRHIGLRDVDPSTEPERVLAVCGGAMLLRARDVRELGGFDPRFFMYVEDVDLCWRYGLAGRKVVYAPTAVVLHDWHGDEAGGGGGGDPPEREARRRFMVERNRLQTIVKNYQWRNLLRVWRALSRYDRGRVKAFEQAAATGAELPRRVLGAVRSARRWIRWHVPGLLWRRRRVQRMRKVPDAVLEPLILPGIGEPEGIGDLYALDDRYSAKGVAELRMDDREARAFGPGWHHPEGPDARWSMGEAWFYLRTDRPWRKVVVVVHPRPEPTTVELEVDGRQAGGTRFDAGQPGELEFTVPEEMPPGFLAECRLRCTPFRPAAPGSGGDTRELGLRVASIRIG